MALGADAVGAAMVEREGMGKGGASPGAGAMALRTLPGEVIGRSVIGVAAHAVRGPGNGVVEGGDGSPGAGAVAGRALAGVMVGGLVLGVAAGTIGSRRTAVIEITARP